METVVLRPETKRKIMKRPNHQIPKYDYHHQYQNKNVCVDGNHLYSGRSPVLPSFNYIRRRIISSLLLSSSTPFHHFQNYQYHHNNLIGLCKLQFIITLFTFSNLIMVLASAEKTPHLRSNLAELRNSNLGLDLNRDLNIDEDDPLSSSLSRNSDKHSDNTFLDLTEGSGSNHRNNNPNEDEEDDDFEIEGSGIEPEKTSTSRISTTSSSTTTNTPSSSTTTTTTTTTTTVKPSTTTESTTVLSTTSPTSIVPSSTSKIPKSRNNCKTPEDDEDNIEGSGDCMSNGNIEGSGAIDFSMTKIHEENKPNPVPTETSVIIINDKPLTTSTIHPLTTSAEDPDDDDIIISSIPTYGGPKTPGPSTSPPFFARPGILAAVIGGTVVGLLCAILMVMFIVYRMRKKDEGSYPIDKTIKQYRGNNKQYA